jgi:serine/threonine protein kinase
MGEVYRARDTRLGRDVAIKVLPDDVASDGNRLARFEREARTVAALNHPNIVVLFSVEDVNETRFLTMELVEGESLDRHVPADGLPLTRVVDLGMAIADALGAAHEKGVVHRDLKPANVMLTREGRVKVLDFGLAKLATSDSPLDATQAITATGPLSNEGRLIGTVPYMAPEQLRGETVDARSDLFAFGIVLYELATGRRPFSGSTVADLTSSILRDPPQPIATGRPELSGELERIVERCLEKNPRDRFQTALDLHNDLRAFRRKLDRGSSPEPSAKAALPPAASIAVLPFVNRSQSADDEYFSDGLSEDLINALSAARGIQVASRTSAFRFRSSKLDIRDIGAQLNVACVLEGSVRRSGETLRVTAQLVNVASGFQLWSERYDREMTDVFRIQDQIVTSIAEALVPALTGKARPSVRRGTENIEAYELYLKGRHYWHQRSPATVRVAIQSFERAIGLDEGYALAYCGLADCYGILRVYGWTRREENQAVAEAAVAQAMALDPTLAEANFSKGFYDFYFERNWRSAGPLFAKSRELNPRSSLIYAYSGLFATMERNNEEAVRFVERSRELDPLSPFIHALSSCAYYIMGRFEDAESSARRALELQPDYLFALWTHGLALCALRQFDAGIVDLQRSMALSRAPFFTGTCGFGLARAGREDEARQLLAELEERASRGEFVPAHARLSILVGLRELPAIRRELAIALDEVTPPFSLWVTAGVFLDAYRADPEVSRLLDAWHEGSLPATPLT